MEISGRELQKGLLQNLQKRTTKLKNDDVIPCIAIVTLGDEETWEAYVRQKIKLADRLGVNKKLINLRSKTTNEVVSVIEKLNADPSVHGLIVQRPFPTHIDTERIIQSVSKEKDIDGFRNDSLYEVPVWLAVKHLITHASGMTDEANLKEWLSNQSILVVGKGETAGRPVINGLLKMGITVMVMDSKTDDRNNLFRISDIVISATGRESSIPIKILKKNCILIGIGLHRKDGQLTGDFSEIEAKTHVSFYTPSPGGVGPLNLYYLFKNLIRAAKNPLDKKNNS
jgi:methylenetetrahydrofolate dehydrogenase (NADP+)/methenyltetrahydrofolate cyclohydrolase